MALFFCFFKSLCKKEKCILHYFVVPLFHLVQKGYFYGAGQRSSWKVGYFMSRVAAQQLKTINVSERLGAFCTEVVQHHHHPKSK